MDNWTHRKFSKKKFPSKFEKLAYTHEADNFAINFSWVYMIGHWWLYGGKWPSPLYQKELGLPNTEGSKEIWNLPSSSPSYMPYKKTSPPPPPPQSTKKISVGRGEYKPWIMDNKDTNADYQKFFRLGDQKWEIVEITILRF